MHSDIFTEIILLLGLSVIAVGVFRKLHLPPVFGYLLVGVISGPYAFGWLPEHDSIDFLAEIGVVFLLFMIGLEFSLAQFWGLRRAVLGLGGIQVLVSTIAGAAIAMLLGVPWQGALVLAGAMSLSSTAIVVKQLTDQLEMGSRHGRLSLAVLLFQDIAVVPFIVIIPILASGGESLLWPLLVALFKGVIAVVGMLALGRWLMRPVFHQVAMSRSVELFTLTALLIALAAAWITNQFGLSLALGAFLAGMLLSETEFKHQIEADVRPFRDILMGLFFITVGTQLNLAALPDIWLNVLLITLGIVLGKGLLVAMITRALGYETGVAVRTGMVLANGGEFGFALITLALSHSLITSDESQDILAAIIFSMLLAPVLIRFNGHVAKMLCASSYTKGRKAAAQDIEAATEGLEGHVIMCGYGRIGQNLGGFLRSQNIDYVALDLNPKLIKEAWDAGEKVFYGDSTHEVILEAAGIANARMLIITIDDEPAAERIISTARSINTRVPILVRSRDDSNLERLEQLGANQVLAETLEASMMMARHVLEALDVPEEEIAQIIEQERDNRYQHLRGYFHGSNGDSVEGNEQFLLHTVTLEEGHYAVGRKLADLDFGDVEVRVACMRRDGVRGENPDPAVELRVGDVLVLQGSAEGLERAESVLIAGPVIG